MSVLRSEHSALKRVEVPTAGPVPLNLDRLTALRHLRAWDG